jgi:hypothetical protein
MNKLILILSIFVFSIIYNKLFSQSFFPDENVVQKWEYVTWNFWGGQCQKRIIKNGQLQDICEGKYIEIFDCDENEQNCLLLGYYRINGDSVLTRLNYIDAVDCSKPFGLTYDFGSIKGEELECALNTTYDPFQKEFWISDIQLVEYEEVERLTRFVNFIPFPNAPNVIYHMKWINGIGSNIHPFYSLSCIGDHCEQEQQVTKVIKNGKLIYQDTILDFSYPCNGWVTETNDEIIATKSLSLSPNPANSNIVILSKENSNISVKYAIYNIQGEVQLQSEQYALGSPIDIRHLDSGIYIAHVMDGKEVLNIKLIKE